MNWSAPGAFKSKVQKFQKEIMGNLLNLLPSSVGLLMSPVYYHKKGNLWQCEQAHLQMLSGENINSDRLAAMLFRSRDERDHRPRPAGPDARQCASALIRACKRA